MNEYGGAEFTGMRVATNVRFRSGPFGQLMLRVTKDYSVVNETYVVGRFVGDGLVANVERARAESNAAVAAVIILVVGRHWQLRVHRLVGKERAQVKFRVNQPATVTCEFARFGLAANGVEIWARARLFVSNDGDRAIHLAVRDEGERVKVDAAYHVAGIVFLYGAALVVLFLPVDVDGLAQISLMLTSVFEPTTFVHAYVYWYRLACFGGLD